MAWGVGPDQVHDVAMANLAEWSLNAAWTNEVNGGRRVVWSDLGDGLDAARILPPEVLARLAADLGPAHRDVRRLRGGPRQGCGRTDRLTGLRVSRRRVGRAGDRYADLTIAGC